MRSEFESKIIDWTNVDWTLRDTDIAKQYNISRERVRQVRKKQNQAPSPMQRQSNNAIKIKNHLDSYIINYEEITVEELAERIGVKTDCLRNYFKRNNLDLKKFKSGRGDSGYKNWNWDLPNDSLRDIYGISMTAICRYRKKTGWKSKYDLRNKNTKEDANFLEAVEEEKLKVHSGDLKTLKI